MRELLLEEEAPFLVLGRHGFHTPFPVLPLQHDRLEKKEKVVNFTADIQHFSTRLRPSCVVRAVLLNTNWQIAVIFVALANGRWSTQYAQRSKPV